VAAIKKRYREKNREKIAEARKRYNETHREQILEKQRNNDKRLVIANDIMPSIETKYWRDKDNGANEEGRNNKVKRNSKPWGPRHSGLF